MEILIFLLGGALGVSLSSLCLIVESIHKRGLTKDVLIDIVYECASIFFIFILYSVCTKLQ